MSISFCDFYIEKNYNYKNHSNESKPYRNERKRANIFIRLKWFILILIWKMNNRKWKKCRHKIKALNKYKEILMKGYRI